MYAGEMQDMGLHAAACVLYWMHVQRFQSHDISRFIRLPLFREKNVTYMLRAENSVRVRTPATGKLHTDCASEIK